MTDAVVAYPSLHLVIAGQRLGGAGRESLPVFERFAEEGRRAYGRIIPPRNSHVELQVRREPVGPCALFTPWNFPADLPSRKLAVSRSRREW